MKKMTGSQIRSTWLKFFESKGHHIEEGSSLIPKNDPTLLWINAGVAALKKYFDGSEVPPSRRITNAQKSIRTNDIDNVGKTDRHHTFFEMLGNFSIGDYFRNEVIPWAVELLTSPQYFDFDKEKLYITYFPDDLATKNKWMESGIAEDHLIPLEGNFWEIGDGPCGPDTEIYFDRGEKYDPKHLGIEMLKKDMENDRYIEIWNIVFSQYNAVSGQKRSEYKELPSKNIDTGSGLERLACVMQETESNFETDLFWPMIEKVQKMSGKKYEENKMAFRVIADHIRAVTFAIADGEVFSNEGRGYVLRRLLRRADRYGRVLGIYKPFLSELVDVVVDVMKDFYPYLVGKVDYIKKLIESEEIKFLKTLENGENILFGLIEKNKEITGSDVFRLYDTFGFPKELTIEMCEEKGIEVKNLEDFDKEMKAQKERARSARGSLQSMNKQSIDLMNFKDESKFSYEKVVIESEVIGLFKDGVKVDSLSEDGEIIVKETPFYAESGGQVADTGRIFNSSCEAKVNNVMKAPNKQHLHYVSILYGELKVGDKVTLEIDSMRRTFIARNHSSVHLLQAALTEVLGDHIAQKGSYVSDEYIHFDFSHFNKMSAEEIAETERRVNSLIAQGIEEETKVLSIDEAKKIGAKALFDDKYGDIVRVVCFGEASKEFCGGTHVKNTQDIGLFVIEFEESVASGVRRIQARTSLKAYELLKKRENMLSQAAKTLGTSSIAEVNTRLNSLVGERNELKKQVEVLGQKLSNIESSNLKGEIEKVGDVAVLVKYSKGASRENLLGVMDTLKSEYKDFVFVLIGGEGSNLPLVAFVGGEGLKKYNAGQLVRLATSIFGGSGGGRPDFANGAGKDASKVEEAIKAVKESLK